MVRTRPQLFSADRVAPEWVIHLLRLLTCVPSSWSPMQLETVKNCVQLSPGKSFKMVMRSFYRVDFSSLMDSCIQSQGIKSSFGFFANQPNFEIKTGAVSIKTVWIKQKNWHFQHLLGVSDTNDDTIFFFKKFDCLVYKMGSSIYTRVSPPKKVGISLFFFYHWFL